MQKTVLLPLLCYAGLGFLALYMPLLHSGAYIPGRAEELNDFFHFHWSYWWARHALVTPGLNVYLSDYVLFPYENNLALHTSALFWLPLWALLEALAGTLNALNGIFWVAFSLTGWSMYALLRREEVGHGLALVGGLALMTTPLMFYAAWWNTSNLVGVFWYPVLLLLWDQVARTRQLGWALLFGLALWGAALTDLQYLLFAPWLVVPCGLRTLHRAAGWSARARLIGLGALALVIFAALMWFAGPLPYLLNLDRERSLAWEVENTLGIALSGWAQVDALPWKRVTVGGWMTGGVLLGLWLSVLRRARDGRWFWLAVALPPALLALGQVMAQHEQPGLAIPFMPRCMPL
ncbi:MAG: hypothetical protein HC915_16305 [Anaerolineae bacterium]|nr:hypothetical protein [Anaerolineae bacterium]